VNVSEDVASFFNQSGVQTVLTAVGELASSIESITLPLDLDVRLLLSLIELVY